jgi:hypothetical protein
MLLRKRLGLVILVIRIKLLIFRATRQLGNFTVMQSKAFKAIFIRIKIII